MPLQRCGPRRRDRSAVRAKTKHSSSRCIWDYIGVGSTRSNYKHDSFPGSRLEDSISRNLRLSSIEFSIICKISSYSNFIIYYISLFGYRRHGCRFEYHEIREAVINFYKTLSICCEVIFAFQMLENTLQMCYSET